MRRETREILNTKPKAERDTFIEEAILWYHTRDIPPDERIVLLMKQLREQNQSTSADDEYIVELEDKLRKLEAQVKQLEQYKVEMKDHYTKLKFALRQAEQGHFGEEPFIDRETLIAIKTNNRVTKLTKKAGLMGENIKRLRKLNDELMATLLHNNITVKSSIMLEIIAERTRDSKDVKNELG